MTLDMADRNSAPGGFACIWQSKRVGIIAIETEKMWIHFSGGGQGQGVTISRLPYILSPLSPDSRPLLCFSRYHVNHTFWLPILIGRECFGLVQNKKLSCKSNHSALSSAITEAAVLRHKLTPGGKIFSVLWTTVVRSVLPGRSSMEGFFPTRPKNTETDQNGPWRHLSWLALSFLRRISTESETDETLTRLTQSTHVYMCHAISFMSYDVRDLERFPISPEVMLFFIPSTNFSRV